MYSYRDRREEYSREETVRLLLERAASVNIKDKDDRTALWYAIQNEYYDLVEVLREYGGKES